MGAVPVHCDGVVFFEGIFEIENMFTRGCFYAKVIDYKAVDDVALDTSPESQSMLAVIVPFCVEALFELFVGKNAGLGETLHSHSDLDIDPTLVVDEIMEIVL